AFLSPIPAAGPFARSSLRLLRRHFRRQGGGRCVDDRSRLEFSNRTMSRASTMVLALLVLHCLLGVLCVVVARGERRSDALRLWGWGLLAYAAGLLITIPPIIPTALRKVVGNGLIAYAPVLTVSGLLRHTRTRLDKRWISLALGLTFLVLVLNHARPSYSVIIDMVAPAPIANVLYIIAA